MGLLDKLFETPADQAMWALGSGLFGVRRGDEGRALMGGMGAYNNAQQEQRRNALTQAQLQEILAQAEQRKVMSAELQRKAQLQQQGLDYLSSGGARPIGSTTMRPETMTAPKLDPVELIKYFGPEAAQKIMESKDWGRPEIKNLEKTIGPNGPILTGISKHGDSVPTGVRPWIEELDPEVQRQKLGRAAASANKTMVNVNSFMPFQEQLQKDAAKGLNDKFTQLSDAPATIQNIQKARSLVTGASPFVGSLAEKKLEIAKFFNNNFGTNIAPEAIKDAETLRTTLFMQIMENLKKMDAQPSQLQQIMMKDALGNLNTDPSAIGSVLGVMEEVLRSKVEGHNKRVNEFTSKKGNENALPYSMTIDLPPASAGSGVTRIYNPVTGKLEPAR